MRFLGSLGELDLFVVSQAHDHFLLQRGQLRTSGGATPTPTHHELERLAWALSGHGSSFRDVCGCGALAAGRHGKRRLLLNPKNDPKVHISIHTRFLETTTTWINLERARKLQVTL